MKYLLAILLAAFLAGATATVNAQSDGQVHKGTGVVTSVDRAGGKVTLKHDPIRSLNWPAMTMAFGVRDKAMLEKLTKDKRVDFEFVQQGRQYIITSIK